MTEFEKALNDPQRKHMREEDYWQMVARRLSDKITYIRHGAKTWKLRAIKAEKQLDNAAAIYTKREEDADARLKWEMEKAKAQLEGERIWNSRVKQELMEVKAHAYDLLKEMGRA